MDTTRDLFAKHSLRCTQQRMAVFEALRESTTHPTAEELFRTVKPRVGRLSLATVYNALEALSEVGLVRRLPTLNGSSRYDADTSPHLHVCFRGTSHIRDVPTHLSEALMDRLPQDVLREIGDALGVEIDGVSIQLISSDATPGETPNGSV